MLNVPFAITVTPFLDDRVPIWPADSGGFFVIMLLGPIPPSFKNSMHWDHTRVNDHFHVTPSFAFGRVEPLHALPILSQLYQSFGERENETVQQRSEAVIEKLMDLRVPPRFLKYLTLGLEAPLKEASRTCQLSPPGGWGTEAYRVIGRDDMAESTRSDPVALINDGYRSLKDFLVSVY
jgi:anaphase-promoting complex subunit 1